MSADLSSLKSQVARLPSGLTVQSVFMPHVHSAVLAVHLATGPRYETPSQNGLSHFLEHMLFRGTEPRPSAHLQALAYERLGGTLLGATYVDHGTLSIAFPPARFREVAALVAETVKSPVFSAIEVERGIVREEILETLDEHGRLIEPETLVRKLAFDQHPLGFPIIGESEHLDTFDEPVLRQHHLSTYTADNCIVTVAGPLEQELIFRTVEREFHGLPRGARPEASPPASQLETRFAFTQHQDSQTMLRMVFRAPAEESPLEPACDMLLRILDDGMSTRLYHRICDSLGLCYDAGASYEAYSDAGLVEFSANTSHERALRVARELLELTKGLRETGPEPEELDKARARLTWQMDLLQDDPESAAEFFALGELSGRPITPVERLERLVAVTCEDIRQAAEQVFQPGGLSCVAIGALSRKERDSLEQLVARGSL